MVTIGHDSEVMTCRNGGGGVVIPDGSLPSPYCSTAMTKKKSEQPGPCTQRLLASESDRILS